MARPPARAIAGSYTRAEIQRRYRQRKQAATILAALAKGEVPAPIRRGRPTGHGAITSRSPGSKPAQPPAAEAAPRVPLVHKTITAAAPAAVTTGYHTADRQEQPQLLPPAATIVTNTSPPQQQQPHRYPATPAPAAQRDRPLITLILSVAQSGNLSDDEIAYQVGITKTQVLRHLVWAKDAGLVEFAADGRAQAVEHALDKFNATGKAVA